MKKDNKGFSLLEMIIVFGMSAILIGSAVSFTGYIRFANSKSCAEKLYSAIDKLQVTSMSKETKKIMCVWLKDGVYYYDVYSYAGEVPSPITDVMDACQSGSSATKIGNSALSIKYKYNGSSSFTTLSDGDGFYLAYASNGGFKSLTDSIKTLDEIVIENVDGDGMTYTIKLNEETGKHFLK